MTTSAELAAFLPPHQRDEGLQLIEQHIVPQALAEAPDVPMLAERVQARVAERLLAAEPGQRLHGLRALAAEIQMEDLYRSASALAIARFLHDGHDVSLAARRWITSDIERLSTRSTAELEREAELYEAKVEEWRQRVQVQHPRVWAGYRTLLLHSRHALASARSGSFATTSGGLHDFVEAAGAETRRFDVF